MKKLLVLFFLLLAFSSHEALWAQDDRREETMRNEQPSSDVVLTVNGNRVRVQNAEPGTVLEVYSILGVRLSSVRIESTDETLTLDLAKGFYILKVGSVARKVVIR